MSFRRLGLAAVIGVLGLIAPALADEPILLRYKLAKGDKLIYKTSQETKQTQNVLNQRIETTTNHDAIFVRDVDAVDSTGTATLKTKAERRKLKVGDYLFDSKSSDRDTTSQVGAAVTPVLERLTGSEFEVLVSNRGAVVDVKGYIELLGDFVKDNPVAQQILGSGGKAGAQIAEQDSFVILGDKPVSPGDQWEVPFDADLDGVGKVKGKIVCTYEANDKIGDRKTVRIGVAPEVSIELKVDAGGVKVTGTLSSSSASGTVQFDPEAGRVLKSTRNLTMSGQLTVEAGGMTIPVDTQSEDTFKIELIEKLPD
ncbi:MAG TPA: hypothetical protein VGH74_05290 [Planctomycetaceae bacterium]|jgi:hypothetical protein